MDKKFPERKCIGCMLSKPKTDLVRIVLQDGELIIDENGKENGRGAYLCRDVSCMKNALKKRAFSRAFKQELDQDCLEAFSNDFTRRFDK